MRITVYGADWCPDVRRTKRWLDGEGIAFDFVDIDLDSGGEAKVLAWNNGRRRIPTVEIAADGEPRVLSVPTNEELSQLVAQESGKRR
jgi:mycoredoxin